MSLKTSLATAAIGLALCTGAWALEAGNPAPELSLPGVKDTVTLSELKGKVTYVDFWASWCGPCKQSFPWMNEMQAKYGANGFQVIGVNLDAKRGDADKFLEQNLAQFTLAFDPKGESAKRFGVKGMPTSVLIGRDGKVVALHSGFRDDERKELEDRITAALAAK